MMDTILSEIFFCIIGAAFICVGIHAYRDPQCKKRFTTALFWILMGFSFIAGPHIPYWITGVIIVLVAVVSAMNGITPASHHAPDPKETRVHADRIGYKIFIPALALAFIAMIVASTGIVSANNSIGVAAFIAAALAFIITKAPAKTIVTESNRLLDNMGPVVFLPQLLAALGALFTACGVGGVVAKGVSFIIPEGNLFAATCVYCIGMALFTMIMGNGFAAFSVITVGIAVPFLLTNGANPVYVGALGLTAGYCGTLITPMAANFNIMPAALLETKSKYSIIKAQAPFAVVMLIIHMILMYVLAF
ncbi:DUF979 domain-containing protein [Clostridium sp. AM58-1XD]|uniref:DUF979 domain-containing protein n=1 Tax=Clostridium sp. AM58-1XD TaxID=2292307 RepID=UPI001A9A69D7|nr:DUF979 domain-containing protein [Clostridium sp. AM58-1XD]